MEDPDDILPFCPECGSGNTEIEGSFTARQWNGLVVSVDKCRCKQCGHEWTD